MRASDTDLPEKATKSCKKIPHYGFERLKYRLKFEIGIG